jgi:hypothetical protein
VFEPLGAPLRVAEPVVMVNFDLSARVFGGVLESMTFHGYSVLMWYPVPAVTTRLPPEVDTV